MYTEPKWAVPARQLLRLRGYSGVFDFSPKELNTLTDIEIKKGNLRPEDYEELGKINAETDHTNRPGSWMIVYKDEKGPNQLFGDGFGVEWFYEQIKYLFKNNIDVLGAYFITREGEADEIFKGFVNYDR